MAHDTPMIRQYHELKKAHPGTILFFRLGDFYEMFFDDALLGSRELEITLTARHKERGEPIPMCGVPYHAAEGHIAKLVRKGYRVAICEQVEDPKSTTKLVRREIVRVVTPGTAVEAQMLSARDNSYLASLYSNGEGAGLALLDLSTGEFLCTELAGDGALARARDEVETFEARELLVPEALAPVFAAGPKPAFTVTPVDNWKYALDHAEPLLRAHFGVASLDGFGLGDRSLAIAAAGGLLDYARDTQRDALAHVGEISFYQPSDALLLDATTVRNLEIVEGLGGSRKQSLLAVIDETSTSMGARLLKQVLLRPPVRLEEVEARLAAVEDLRAATIARDRLRSTLGDVQDLERLSGRVAMGRAGARDLVALRRSLDLVPQIRAEIEPLGAPLVAYLANDLDDLPDVRDAIASALADDAPIALADGGTIREGYSAELDELRGLARESKQFIAKLEARERQRTGISSLKVRFNNVFGYFIEISKSNLRNAPAEYERRQTLANAERFTIPELKEYEAKVLGAEERILAVETDIFGELRAKVAAETRRIQATARAVALVDVLASFAETAARRYYCRPVVTEGDEILIRNGRHPIVEAAGERFIPNDLYLNNSTDRLLVITGPNMGGKSVYLRQTALIAILAHAGSFVPATEARVALLDRIFTRVGASDSLASGRSTFMVEMTETANILNTATARSLVLLDEVGRGTATFDGLSLAWAIAEYLHDNARHAAKTLFATHYHEMTELAKILPGVKNYQMGVREERGDIIFLRKVVEGEASKSYGIEVARLAGLPAAVIARAREILDNLEANELDVTGRPKLARHLPSRAPAPQPNLWDAANEAIVDELRHLDVDALAPERAKQVLAALKARLL
jgi:DNA mismatch repair protein MutS